MSKYEKLMTEILENIFEGYVYRDKKLKVINKEAVSKAKDSIHKLVLEKSTDLWEQLEAAEDSFADVAEEISFEELNNDPSSVDRSASPAMSQSSTPEPTQQQEPTLESMIGESDEMDFDSIFKEGMDMGGMMKDTSMMDAEGDDEGMDEVEDGDEDYSNLEIGMDDDGLGSPGMEDDMDLDGGMENGGEDELGVEDELGGEDELGDEDLSGFNFDLDLDDGGEEDEMEEMMGEKPYRMETKGDKDDDDDDDKDDDKDDDNDDDDDKEDKRPEWLKKKQDKDED